LHNVHFDLWFDSYISNTKKIMTKKTYAQPYTHKTSVSRRYYYMDKRCTKMGAWKITKEPNEKKMLVLYNISKDQNSNLGSPKNKRATKPN
jgi:hypothetical protein